MVYVNVMKLRNGSLPGRNAGRFGASVLRHHVVGVMAVDLLVLRLAQHGKTGCVLPCDFLCEIGGRVLFFRARTFFIDDLHFHMTNPNMNAALNYSMCQSIDT